MLNNLKYNEAQIIEDIYEFYKNIFNLSLKAGEQFYNIADKHLKQLNYDYASNFTKTYEARNIYNTVVNEFDKGFQENERLKDYKNFAYYLLTV